MDTSQIKKFAVEARNILKQGVINRITATGFNDKGEVAERNIPQRLQGNTLFMGQLYDENFYDKWAALNYRVQTKGIKEVYEEAAYTWFNRLMAIRIMEKNGFTEPVLAFDNDRLRIPRIVSNARAGQFFVEDASDREKLSELLMDDTKTTEQFTLLITSFCHTNPVINNCFGGVSEYTEILLPTNILSEGGFVDLLNHTGFISDDDYKQSELIGWLYQFYISEKKDQVFASFKGGKKAEAEDIPAATQIFTPNWIVKYMVQNTIGRIYLDNNPDSSLKDNWKYLVEPSEPTPEDSIFKYDDPKELTMADLGCGSGHILNEGFDILYDIYIEEGYSRKQAVENIFKYNLTGVDLDTRAKQLATFALMMKACQKDDSFLDCHIMPNVLDMPDVDRYSFIETDGHFCCAYQIRDIEQQDKIHLELVQAFELLKQAHNLGSIMKFDLSDFTLEYVKHCVAVYEDNPQFQNSFATLIHAYKLILTLTNKFASVVMNPPYMGSTNMNALLVEYVKSNYEIVKGDLCTVFMVVQRDRTINKGYYSNIVPPSWMFITSFESYRIHLITGQTIHSLLHLSRGVFGADFGSVCTVFQNYQNKNASGTYFRLNKRTFQEFDQEHLHQLLKSVLDNHNFKFLFDKYSKDNFTLSHNEKGERIYFENVKQNNFTRLPGSPIGYWLSNHWYDTFGKSKIENVVEPKAGIVTGDDKYFVRYWFEASYNDISLTPSSSSTYSKYHIFYKGGGFRKYYGNGEYIIKLQDFWDPNHYNVSIRRGDPDYYFKKGIGWSQVNSSEIKTFRVIENAVCGTATPTIYPYEHSHFNYLLGLLNTRFISDLLKLFNPTINLLSTNICDIPLVISDAKIKYVSSYVEKNIVIAKSDWDAHETSWDFKQNELVALNEDTYVDTMYAMYDGTDVQLSIAAPQDESLQWRLELYKEKWEDKFNRLHSNEEELNRLFIEIYGLQDELTPEVPMEEVTILQQGEISIEDDELVWHDDIIIKQLISYAIGCMMGRYRLDREGLWIAHPNPTDEEICTYDYKERSFTIDDDGIMPLMSRDCGFDDNGVLRITDFLRVAFGEECLTENLNFVEKCLGKTIEDYLKKDFWKDHKKMYQNRPIYWLFSSKKGAFQVLAYMHRMNPYTVEQIRNKYLLPHIEYLNGRITEMELKEATLSTSERKALSKLKENLAECQEYHERLHLVADQQIGFDLDDGVVVNYAKFGDVVSKIK